jgi:hypothetical protein
MTKSKREGHKSRIFKRFDAGRRATLTRKKLEQSEPEQEKSQARTRAKNGK